MNEVSHANYSECIMNFIHHMSNELACRAQRERERGASANWQQGFMHNYGRIVFAVPVAE